MGRWNTSRTLRDRFLEKVSITQDHWLWIGATIKMSNGEYGTLLLERGKIGNILAHRASWLLHRGPIPRAMNVLHKCDFPRCVNPEHLFIGSQQDNMQNCKRKGRLMNPRSLARKFGVSQTVIGKVLRRESWVEVLK